MSYGNPASYNFTIENLGDNAINVVNVISIQSIVTNGTSSISSIIVNGTLISNSLPGYGTIRLVVTVTTNFYSATESNRVIITLGSSEVPSIQIPLIVMVK